MMMNVWITNNKVYFYFTSKCFFDLPNLRNMKARWQNVNVIPVLSDRARGLFELQVVS